MYNTSTFNEDIRINHSGDEALMEALDSYINESSAGKKAKSLLASGAKKAAGAAIATGTTMAIHDLVDHGDPLYSAKIAKDKVKENLEVKDKERQRKKDEEDFNKWLKDSEKKKALKEDCQLLIDESARTAYYAFVVPEGA